MSAYQANTYPAFADYHDLAGDRSVDWFRRALLRLAAWSTERSQYRQTLAELSRLNDRELADIGILRCDIRSIANHSAKAKRADV